MKNTLPQTFQEYLPKFIGIPYQELDCWQLVRTFYYDVLKVTLNDFDYTDPLDYEKISLVVNESRGKFSKTNKPDYGDIVLMKIQGYASHVGIYLGDFILHTKLDTGSHLQRLDLIKNKIEGYYRYGQS